MCFISTSPEARWLVVYCCYVALHMSSQPFRCLIFSVLFSLEKLRKSIRLLSAFLLLIKTCYSYPKRACATCRDNRLHLARFLFLFNWQEPCLVSLCLCDDTTQTLFSEQQFPTSPGNKLKTKYLKLDGRKANGKACLTKPFGSCADQYHQKSQ